jgi:hypothetical protein
MEKHGSFLEEKHEDALCDATVQTVSKPSYRFWKSYSITIETLSSELITFKPWRVLIHKK